MTARRSTRILIGPLLLATAAAVTVGLTAVAGTGWPRAAAAPPPNPTDGQLSQAAAQKAALANDVGRLSAAVTAAQTRLNQLQAAQEMAEQKLAYRLSLLQQAKQSSEQARARVSKAQTRVEDAQANFQTYVQSAYMSGSIGGSATALLTAPDPSVVLQQTALTEYEADHQIDAIGALRQATVERSNAEEQAREAVLRQRAAARAAARAKAEADTAVTAGIAAQRKVQTELTDNQAALTAAQERLATLNHERAAYDAWQKKQAEIRAARLAAQRKAEQQARIARERELARERAQRERQARNQGNSPAGGGSSGRSASPQPIGGHRPWQSYGWTPAKGREAVRRAMRYLGWMYAWAGGNANGPTYGVCAGSGAFNDCHIVGFDCSGLTLYGWAPFITLAHYTVTQYLQAGSFHPSISQLRPGDLVFWSSNGTIGAIHHVAMYIGHGNVIQAPQSGSVIQITPLYAVDWGYYGATRPLT